MQAFSGAYTGYVILFSTFLYFSRRERELMVSRFGVAAVLLELVPVASVFFAFTNTAGAALWAADLEKGEVDRQGTSPALREKAKKAE